MSASNDTLRHIAELAADRDVVVGEYGFAIEAQYENGTLESILCLVEGDSPETQKITVVTEEMAAAVFTDA